MAEQRKINERLVGLTFLGLVLLNFPILGLFSKELFFCGVPLLYFYIFFLWFLFIMASGLILRKRHSQTSTSSSKTKS